MTSDDEQDKKRDLNPLADFELDDDVSDTEDDSEAIEEIIQASPLASELDASPDAPDEDHDFVAELSTGEEDVDTDIDDTLDFSGGSDEKSGGMKKLMAPVLVLLIAAGAGGYIVMNPSILGGGDAPQTQISESAAPDGGVTNSAFGVPVPAKQDDGADVASIEAEEDISDISDDLPQPVVHENDVDAMDMEPSDSGLLAANDDTQDNIDISEPVSGTSEAEDVSEAVIVNIDEPAGKDMPSEPVMPVIEEVTVPVPEMEKENIAPAIEIAENVPRAPSDNMAPKTEEKPAAPENIEENSVMSQETESAEIASGKEETVSSAVPENDGIPSDLVLSDNKDSGKDVYYDSEVKLPTSKSKGPRKVDPTVEPASKFVVATKNRSATDQESMIVSANRALKLRRYDAALDMYSQLYSKNKRDKRILMGLAISQQNTGRIESAIKTYEELLELDSNNADALVNMLGLLREQYPSVALRRLMDLQSKFPNNAGIAAQIGVTQADLGHFDDAMRYLGIAASLEPRNAQHLFNMAVVADRQKMTAQAIQYYEQALEADVTYSGGNTLPRDTIYDRLSKLRRR